MKPSVVMTGPLLIIDDNPVDRELFRVMAQNKMSEIFSDIIDVESCEQALSRIENTLPRCCLVDYRLPTQNGLDFLKALRCLEYGMNIPVIIMTGDGDEDLAAEIMRNGAQDYLVKNTITPDSLKHSVDNAIRTCQLQNKLEYLAHYDALTGLLNRSLFLSHLEATINKCDRYGYDCSLLYIDVDDFKLINDTYGHAAGDRVLEEIAQRIKNSCRVTDSAARLGGDEFAVLLERIDEKNTNITAEKILQEVSLPIFVDGKNFQVSLSIGVAHYSKHMQDVREFIRKADEAMYCAKRGGKANLFKFSQEQQYEWDRRKYLEHQLPEAIKNDQLQLVYQPMVDTLKGVVGSIEALVRWYPEQYSINPLELVGMIKQLDLFDEFHEWLISTACKQCAQWQPDMGDTQLCINIPASHIHKDSLMVCFHDAFKAYNVEPSQITLEITETDLMSEPELGSKMLTALSEQGVHIAIDDFGSGYSSLFYLTQLPVNVLKIDKEFVQKMEVAYRSQRVIEATTSLAHSLDLKVVAEGVETQVQYELVKSAGCDLIQGYYFAKPTLAKSTWNEFLYAALEELSSAKLQVTCQ